MKTLQVIGKYLDQPILVSKFSKVVPGILIAGGGIYAARHIKNSPDEKKNKETVKIFSVLTTTIASALIAPKLTAKLIKNDGHNLLKSLSQVKKHQAEIIDEFVSKNKIAKEIEPILEKAKEKTLSYKEIKILFENSDKTPQFKKFLSDEKGLIPDPENIDSKHIFGEIKRLSLLGLIPVLGGVAGGIIGDKLTEKTWKEKIPNKIKEGSYQYLANIFLCNVGAGAALWLMEKKNITAKAPRALGMAAGIILTGIVGGSAIANLIGKVCIDPFFNNQNDRKYQHRRNFGDCKNHGNCKRQRIKEIYSERTPEALDVGLHADDMATVAVMSGLKWIEPALPILYSISGFRAGIGYRNRGKN